MKLSGSSARRNPVRVALIGLMLFFMPAADAGIGDATLVRAAKLTDLIEGINLANEDTSRLVIILINSTIVIDGELPLIEGRISVILRPPSGRLVTGEIGGPSPVPAQLLRSQNAFVFLYGLLNLRQEKSHVFPHDQAMIQGFATLIEASNSTIILNGVSAHCNGFSNHCIDAENSRVIVANSSFYCSEACLWNIGGVAAANTVDFTGLRDSLMDSGLAASEISSILRKIDQSEDLLNQYDIAVVDSVLNASGPALFAGAIGATLVGGSYLEARSRQENVLKMGSQSTESVLRNSVFINSNPASSKPVLDLSSDFAAENILIKGGEDGLRVRDPTPGSIPTLSMKGVAVSLEVTGKKMGKAGCDFGSNGADGQVISKGFNIIADESCALDGPGDQQNTDPGFFFPTANFMVPEDGDVIPRFADDSPAIDGGATDISEGALPCSTTDFYGLPRPQDGNGNGDAECDVGPVEMQQGANIGPRQTGAFFDANRNGEGVFVEMLGGGKALVYLFSYTPQGDAFWAVGVGDVVGNGISIKKESFFTTEGPTFGPNFNPADVQFIPFADMAMSFPGCANSSKAGVLAIDPNNALGYPPLLSRTTRITSVLSCSDGAAMGPGFSGSFVDPTHNGEGVIVQVISPTSALVIWFTYDANGNQDWILGVGTINGNAITVTDAFTQTGPQYGPAFDTNDVVSTTWGTFTVTFDGGCNNADLDYDSMITAFGSGSQALARISDIDGLECGL